MGMTTKARWLAALRGEAVDCLPFWPKLDGAFLAAQTGNFAGMSLLELHAWMGSDPHIFLPDPLREQGQRCRLETRREGDTLYTIYHTPDSELVLLQRFDAGSQAWHPICFPVRDVTDIRCMTRFYDDLTVTLDSDALAAVRAQADALGEKACTAQSAGTSPLMHWVQFLAGVEGAHLLQADYPDETAVLFAAMQRVLLRRAALLVEHSPADLLYLVENTSTSLISPGQYRRDNLPHVRACAEVITGAGRLMALHMCGRLHALLPDLATTGVHAFEAFTAPTLGDTTLRDGRTACPDVCLIGGTHAMLWLEPAESIIAYLEDSLATLPHLRRLILTSAGVMPPACAPDIIRRIADWLHTVTVN